MAITTNITRTDFLNTTWERARGILKSEFEQLYQTLKTITSAISTIGLWILPTFNTNNFSATGAMNWTVDPFNLDSYEYTLIGDDTMSLQFHITNSIVSGVGDTYLKIKLPAPYVTASRATAPFWWKNATPATYAVGIIDTLGKDQPYLSLLKDPTGTVWTADAAGTTSAFGSITFQVRNVNN